MKLSGFQFRNPVMTKSIFKLNSGFQQKEHEEVEMPVQINAHRNSSGDDTSAYVEVEVVVGEESDQLPFYVAVSYGADFKWLSDDFDEKKVEYLLSQNAPALLLGYARVAISMITNFSPYPAYNLPFIDLTKGI